MFVWVGFVGVCYLCWFDLGMWFVGYVLFDYVGEVLLGCWFEGYGCVIGEEVLCEVEEYGLSVCLML